MNDLMNRMQLASYFKVDVSTINNWRKKGCPFIKLGTGRIMYKVEEVEKWYFNKK